MAIHVSYEAALRKGVTTALGGVFTFRSTDFILTVQVCMGVCVCVLCVHVVFKKKTSPALEETTEDQ